MPSQLKKAIKLVKKTGDRLIVFESPESEEAYVVMDLGQYEDIIDCCSNDCGDDCECGHDYSDDDEPEINLDLPEEDFEPENFDYASEVKGLTEEELLDKINRDIALWKENQKVLENEDNSAEKSDHAVVKAMAGEDEDHDNDGSMDSMRKWAIKPQVKENADEIIDEDRHYLEEVKF